MRVPKRIKPLLPRIKELCELTPDWYLAQLINNVVDCEFYTEDDILEEMVDKYIKEYKKYYKMTMIAVLYVIL